MENREPQCGIAVPFPDRSDVGRGIVRISSKMMSDLGIGEGGPVLLKADKSAVALALGGADGREVQMDAPTRFTLGIDVDSEVQVLPAEIEDAMGIIISVSRGDPGDVDTDALTEKLLGRAFSEKMFFIVPGIALGGSDVMFTVESLYPRDFGIVTEDTVVTLSDDDGFGYEDRGEAPDLWYKDIGGMGREIQRIKELVEWPLTLPDSYKRLGMDPPKGVLIHGPSGTGKTMLALAAAKESGAYLRVIHGPEMFGPYIGTAEEFLRDAYESVKTHAPAILFIDEIDVIASRPGPNNPMVQNNALPMLITIMDETGPGDRIIFIGATNRIEAIDPSVRRAGRFGHEIEVGIPTPDGRREILEIRTVNRGMPLQKNVDLVKISEMCQGFTGADISALASEAAHRAVMRLTDGDMEEFNLLAQQSSTADISVTMEDFESALADIKPSGMREVAGGIPKITWNDIGGLDSVRREIELVLPGEPREKLVKLGVRPGKGILLYGPPGTGKTLIAKAVANEKSLNFIPVNGPELLSMWLGESEKGLRRVFERAKSMAPSVIFFDEIDSIAPRREAEPRNRENMVAQLLTCLDGVSELKDVIVLAATNRPDMIDPAVLRPGRIDSMILVGAPDTQGREEILKVCTRKMPLDNVDLAHIASKTAGMVGADLEALCREAGTAAYRRGSDSVTGDDFEAALKKVRPSADKDTEDRYREMAGEAMKNRDRWENSSFYR